MATGYFFAGNKPGFGFIYPAANRRGTGVFAHKSDFSNNQLPADATEVSYTLAQTERGGKAVGIQLIAPVAAMSAIPPQMVTRDAPIVPRQMMPKQSRQDDTRNLPYAFHAIDIENASTATPVWHDGNNVDEADRFDGYLNCTLATLTPLHVGWVQTEAQHSTDYLPAADGKSGTLAAEFGGHEVDPKKTLREPLRLNSGQIVIPKDSIEGMLRAQIAAITHAPMQNVAERTYSYRPNMKSSGYIGGLHARIAIVQEITDTTLKLAVAPAGIKPVFVAQGVISTWPTDNIIPTGFTIRDIKLDPNNRFRYKISKPTYANDEWRALEEYRVGIYKTGIDGNAQFAQKFGATQTPPRTIIPYEKLLVPADRSIFISLSKSDPAYQAFLDTNEHLCNTKTGHIAPRHPLEVKDLASAIKTNEVLVVGQAIFVEWHPNKNKIVSLGTHYRYRTRYTSTVTQKNGALRTELDLLASEKLTADDKKPGALATVRSLMGYANKEIGKDSYTRYAGRIWSNFAVECAEPNTDFTSSERFEKYADSVWLPLKEQGQSRPSAVEFYLKQSSRAADKLQTYGDLPGEAGADLMGRKYYPHQAGAKLDDALDNTADKIKSKQTALLGYVSKAGTKFKFRISFRALNRFELALLLNALMPGDQHALKLGSARAFGFGSVRIQVDPVHGFDKCEVEELKPFALGTEPPGLKAWREAMQFEHTPYRAFPMGGFKPATATRPAIADSIYGWHTGLRGKYSEDRRVLP